MTRDALFNRLVAALGSESIRAVEGTWEWRARCPAHDDDHPSLHITFTADRALLHCFAGCPSEKVLEKLGLTFRDLFYDAKAEAFPVQAVYDYRDENGQLLFQVLRMRDPKKGKTFRQRRPGADGWIWSLGDTRRVLYRLPEVLAAVREGQRVFIVEGEKDADNLAALGLAATTNPNGAGKWRPEYSESLRGARVVIIPDNDEPGRQHAQQVAQALAGVAAEIKVLELPGLPPKGDVSDWLAAGGTREELLRVAEQAPLAQAYLSEADTWEPPVPFTEYDLPVFPVDALPDWLRKYVVAEAEATQTPTDLAGMLALAVCGAAIAKKITVHVWEGWTEPTNLFVVVALPPGSRKSAVFADVTEPVTEYEQELAQAAAPEIEAQKARKRIMEAELARKQAEAAKAKDGDREAKTHEAQHLARELATFHVDSLPRLWADDCSPEKLASLLAEQGGRIAILSPEGGVFEIMGGRYSANALPNIEVYLKAHAGDAIRVDRIGRSPEYVQSPALTVGLAVQPDVIRGLARKPGFRGRGLLARFLYAIPRSNIGTRKIKPPPVPDDVKAAYRCNMKKMFAMAASADGWGAPTVHTLRLGQEAQTLMEDFCRWLEPRLPEQAELGNIQDWASKLAGAVARIAGILHVAQNVDHPSPWELQVSGETMRRAIAVGKYLIPHAQAAFAEMGADPEMDAARYLLNWLTSRGITEITKRDLFQGVRGRFKRAAEIDAPLSILEDHGYIRQVTVALPGGGRPSILIKVNPLYTKPSKHSKPPKRGSFEDIEGFEKEGIEDFEKAGSPPGEGREALLENKTPLHHEILPRPQQCPFCGGGPSVFVYTVNGWWQCSVCHPPGPGEAVVLPQAAEE